MRPATAKDETSGNKQQPATEAGTKTSFFQRSFLILALVCLAFTVPLPQLSPAARLMTVPWLIAAPRSTRREDWIEGEGESLGGTERGRKSAIKCHEGGKKVIGRCERRSQRR